MTFILTKNLLQGLIVFQSLFFAVFLISYSKGKRRSNLLLSGFNLILGFHFLNLILSDYTFFIPRLNICFMFLYAPIIYLYCKSYLKDSFNFKVNQLLHLLPLAYCILWNILFYDDFYNTGYLKDLISIPVYVHILIYLGITYRSLVSKKLVSVEVKENDFRWLRFFIITFLTSILVYITVIILKITSDKFLEELITITFLLIMLFLVNGFVYNALVKPELFRNNNLLKAIKLPLNKRKYAYSNLSEKESEEILTTLLNYMKDQKPYKDSLISLSKLADKIDIDSRHLSQIINEKLHKNFYDFINEYRIKEANNILKDKTQGQIKINELMYLVGFNSKSTFNTAFKKYIGKTPSQVKGEVNLKD